MACGTFKNIEDAAKQYQISVTIAPFVESLPVTVSEHFQQELTYIQQHLDVRMSEAAISEFLLAPILKEIWEPYDDVLLFWSHVSLSVGTEFEGFPDYLFTKKTAWGMVRDKPYVLVVQAKEDDFEGGWGQCFAAMIAAQILNGNRAMIIQGCVSNGEVWQFAKLQEARFVRDPRSFTITALVDLFAALNDVFARAKQQAEQS